MRGQRNADPGEPELLEDLDEAVAREAWRSVRDEMLAAGTWFEAIGCFKGARTGREPPRYRKAEGRRILALGRSDFYDAFLRDLEASRGERVYQSDYMAWIDPGDPYRSLLWYIDSAETIDFSLEGIPAGDLRRAAAEAVGLKAGRRELGLPYMTLWEVNRVVWGPAVRKTRWHLRGSMDANAAREALGSRVDPEAIVT
jgi:hypothetical protein